MSECQKCRIKRPRIYNVPNRVVLPVKVYPKFEPKPSERPDKRQQGDQADSKGQDKE